MEYKLKNKALKFWLYLIQKDRKVFTKLEFKEKYRGFQEMWKDKSEDFERILDSLRKTRIKYMFHKKWYVLGKEEFEDLKHNKLDEHEFFFRFLEDQKIAYYVGLSSAKYLNNLTWQSLKVIYVINSKFKLRRKIGNVEINLIKFPKELIINLAIVKTNRGILYSNNEKTLLDEIYFNEYKKGKLQIMDYNLKELDIEKIKAYLTFYSKYKGVKKELIKKLNPSQVKIL